MAMIELVSETIHALGSLTRAKPVTVSMASPMEATDAASDTGALCFAKVTDCKPPTHTNYPTPIIANPNRRYFTSLQK